MATKSKPTRVDLLARSILAIEEGPYVVLGLLPTATPEAVKNAHRSLASLLHPDRNPGNIGAAAAMAKVNEAYTLLTNEKAKRKHDLTAGHLKKCGTCNGSKTINRNRGFKVHKVRCPDCGGSGKRTPKPPRDRI